MGKLTSKKSIGIITIIVIIATGCARSPDSIQRALGRDIAIQRTEGEDKCPTISTFTVSPLTVRCGDPVTLELRATTLHPEQLRYTWEIEGQTFETGQRVLWKTPTCKTIGEPEKAYTVRGVVSDGTCDVAQIAAVTVRCNCAFDVMVHFEFAKADLDSTAKSQLDKIGAKLQQNPQYALLIEGHTDYIGSNQSNKSLGERRAETVKKYFASTWNIDPSRVITRSFGEEEPIASNETSPGRAKNRRAEVFRVILKTK